MSTYGDILDAVLADCVTAIPDLTTERGFVPLAKVQTYPFAYSFMGEVGADRLDWMQERGEFAAVIVLVTNGETQEQLYTKIDAIRAQLYASANRTLGGLVDSFHIANVAPFEQPDPGGVKGASMTVLCVRDS